MTSIGIIVIFPENYLFDSGFMPVITLRSNVPETVNPEEVKRKVELEIARELILKDSKKVRKTDLGSSEGFLGRHLRESLMNMPWRLSSVIYIDANIFYNYLFDSEFAGEAEELLKKLA